METSLNNTEVSFALALILIVLACFLALTFLGKAKKKNEDDLEETINEYTNQNKWRENDK